MYFWNKTLHVSDSSSAHHQEFFTVHTAVVCHTGLLTACEQDQDGTTVLSWSCSQAVSKPVWHIPLLCVQWRTPDDGQRNCPKHVEFYFKNKFEKLVYLVGFIIRICHNSRSPVHQIWCTISLNWKKYWKPQNTSMRTAGFRLWMYLWTASRHVRGHLDI